VVSAVAETSAETTSFSGPEIQLQIIHCHISFTYCSSLPPKKEKVTGWKYLRLSLTLLLTFWSIPVQYR
jgi:hypothetical protein